MDESMTTLWWVQLAIVLAYIGGALADMLYSWLDSGEPFNLRKFAASVLLTAMGAGAGAAAMANPNIDLKPDGVLLYCFAAVYAGFGTVEATRKISKAAADKPVILTETGETGAPGGK
jgi:hypothetical protein